MTDFLLASLPAGPFQRLAALLGDVQPGKAPINLSVGDPAGTVPDFVRAAMHDKAASMGNYPPITGTAEWRAAAAKWLNTRFDLAGKIDADKNVLPLAGTREGLFSSLFPLMPVSKAGAKPIVAMPNPFYQCYAAAAISSGAEPMYVAATATSGFLPDYAELSEDTLKRLVAVYICSPSNPEGAVADSAYWKKLFALADRHDFIVLADECYADIYFGEAPASALHLRREQDFSRLLTFHSLSKRSGLPGLRSGMVAGDAARIEKLRAFRNVAGPQTPGPVLAAATAAWGDEAHVTEGRKNYAAKMEAAERILGNRMQKPGGGFFLWLPVGNGEETALELWRQEGVKVLPGAYMGRGETQANPGFSYVRVALVSDLSTIVTALERLRAFLDRR